MRPFSITLSTDSRSDFLSPREAGIGDLVVATCPISVLGQAFVPGDALRIVAGDDDWVRLADADGAERVVDVSLIPLSVVIVPASYLPEAPVVTPVVTATVPLATVERIVRSYAESRGYGSHATAIIAEIRGAMG